MGKKGNSEKSTKRLLEDIAKLSKLQIDEEEKSYFPDQFEKTLKVIQKLENLDTSKVDETYHVTGLVNVFREDEVDAKKVLSQEEALANSKNKHNGFFVVKAIFDNES